VDVTVKFEGNFVFTAANVVSVAAPVGKGNADAETGWVTPLPSTSKRVEVTVKLAGTLVFRAESVVSVAAPVGKGNAAAEIGCVTPLASTKSRVAETVKFAGTFPSIDVKEAFPVVCRAEVASPTELIGTAGHVI
jgi:hypothetical protein